MIQCVKCRSNIVFVGCYEGGKVFYHRCLECDHRRDLKPHRS